MTLIGRNSNLQEGTEITKNYVIHVPNSPVGIILWKMWKTSQMREDCVCKLVHQTSNRGLTISNLCLPAVKARAWWEEWGELREGLSLVLHFLILQTSRGCVIQAMLKTHVECPQPVSSRGESGLGSFMASYCFCACKWVESLPRPRQRIVNRDPITGENSACSTPCDSYFPCCCDLWVRNFCLALHVGTLIIEEILHIAKICKNCFLPET